MRKFLVMLALGTWILAACDDPRTQDPLDLGPPDLWNPPLPDGSIGGTYGGSNQDTSSTADLEEVVEPPPCDEITFSYTDPSASSVWVTGSFTDWAMTDLQGALSLTHDGSGTWTLTTTLADRGQHLYMFIVDETTWVPDPNTASRAPDHLGGTRSVVEVCEISPTYGCGTVHFHYENASASSVALVGDFTNWEATQAVPMTDLGDGNWRANVDLTVGQSYAYKLIVDGSTTWIPDPANPNQVDDGFGGFNSVVEVADCSVDVCGDVAAFDWRDAVLYFAMVDRFYDSDGKVGGPGPVSGASGLEGIGASGQYEGGDLAGVTARINDGYLTDLGVTALWLSAPYENRDTAGAAIDPNQDPHMYSAYHGYWPSPANIDYSGATPNPRPLVEDRIAASTDPEQELRTLIDTAHGASSANGHGIKVLFDYVMNHVDDQSELYQRNRSWFVPGNPTCADIGWDNPGTHCAFTSYLPPFDYDNTEARAWSIDDAVWWAKEFGIDGYRLDAIKHVPMAWLTEFRARFNQEFPDPDGGRFYLVGETFVWDNPDGYATLARFINPDTQLDGQFDFPFRAKVCEVARNEMGLDAFASWMNENDRRYGPGALMSTWVGNHDIPRAIHAMTFQVGCREGSYPSIGWTSDFTQPSNAEPYERLRVAFALMLTNPGVPLLYYGDEIGLAGGGDPDNRRMMPWNDSQLNSHQLALRDAVSELATLRAENPAITRGRRSTLSVDGDLWVYRMGGCLSPGAGDVIVAVNAGGSSRSTTIPSGSYTDLRSGSSSSGGSISLGARDYAIFRVE